MCVFIETSVCAFMNVCVYIMFLKKIDFRDSRASRHSPQVLTIRGYAHSACHYDRSEGTIGRHHRTPILKNLQAFYHPLSESPGTTVHFVRPCLVTL